MPTPFMHLDIAEKILAHPQLNDAAREQLEAAWSAFYLGSVAADYQSIGDVPREVTHFYALPMPQDEAVGWEKLQLLHPELAHGAALDTETAVFMAAYAAHLHYDVVWFKEVLLPFFVYSDSWEGVSRRDRFTIHNVLLTYMDGVSLGKLPVSAENTLHTKSHITSLPFIDTALLDQWQQMIVTQLSPDAPVHTVQIYAERLGISPDEFAARLDDTAWLQAELFDRVPLAAVENIFARALDESVTLINNYLTKA